MNKKIYKDFEYTINFLEEVEEYISGEISFIEEDIATEPYNKEDLESDLNKLKALTNEDKINIAKKVMNKFRANSDTLENIIEDIHYNVYHNTKQDKILETFIDMLEED